MAVYTTVEKVKQLIPKRYKPADLTDPQITEWIQYGTQQCDHVLMRDYVPFNDIANADYKTPAPVEMACAHIAAGYGLQQIKVGGQNTKLAEEIAWHMAQAYGEGDRVGLLGALLSDAPVPYKAQAETIAWGTTDTNKPWMPGEYQAFLAEPTPLTCLKPPNILSDTVRIEGGTPDGNAGFTVQELLLMRPGHEYVVDFDRKRGKWLFTAKDRRLKDNVTGLKVVYDWDNRRLFGESRKRPAELQRV